MRTQITIVGIGQRRSGTSKTGRPYDFTPIAITYDDPYITGQSAAVANVDGSVLGDYAPTIGDSREAFVRPDFRSGRVYVDGIL